MKSVITGGGTGGHVYPALEVGHALAVQGFEIHYFGSLRGHEVRACKKADIPFQGFPSEPLYSLKSLRGLRAAANLARATVLARRAIMKLAPDVVFSTGGYSSAPVLYAAKQLGIPYVIHEQNVIPGRTNRILSRHCFAVATTFHRGAEHFGDARVVRTGLPVRQAFRKQTGFNFDNPLAHQEPVILAMGGSQGASAINEAVLATAVRMARKNIQWVHLTGPGHFDSIQNTATKLGVNSHYKVRAYLDGDEMAAAVFDCSLAVCRSGASSLAELAAYRKPSIMVPLPSAFANHQYHNAKEFEDMGAGTILGQNDLQPSTLESRILLWQDDPARLAAAERALAEWDAPDAVNRIVALILEAQSGTV